MLRNPARALSNRAKTRSKQQILEKVVQGRLSKTEASEKLNVSRKTIYKWLKKYSDWTPETTLTKRETLQEDILHIVAANPQYGPRKISQELEKAGEKLSERSVWKLLRELNLATSKRREVYVKRRFTPGHLKLNAGTRKRMVEEVVLGKRPVKGVTEEYGVSRKTFAKWKTRYLVARDNDENLLLALSDQNPKGISHPRATSEIKVKKVLDLVTIEPELSSHKIAKRLKFIGNHGVQKVLERHNLTRLERRVAYSRSREHIPKPSFAHTFLDRVRLVLEQFIPSLAPAPPPVVNLLKILFSSATIVAIFAFVVFCWTRFFGRIAPYTYQGGTQVGFIFAGIALTMGSIFFLYSLKYYLTLAIVLSFSQSESTDELAYDARGDYGAKGKGKKKLLSWILGFGDSKKKRRSPVGLKPDLENISIKKYPFISVQIPLYNEKRVVKRVMEAITNFDYPEYEVFLCDDSTDETTTIINKYQRSFGKLKTRRGEGWILTSVEIKPGVVLKHLHRTSRSGFKGGALAKALEHVDPKTEFVSVFDADFVPYPDTLQLFLKYFKIQNNMSEDYKQSNVAAVQGYQWHVLNKSENWITRGVRAEYAGSYVVERSGREIYGALKQIAGSVYMVRKDLLDEIGWGTSITEDFQLTLRLYERGYKVVYTPYIQAPAECVSTFKDLVRQRMRWAEGHSNNVRKMFMRLIFNKKLASTEKLEFLYLSPYYLQAFFFLIGTISWILSATLFPAGLPFWTSLWGWSLVLTNFFSLPLVNSVGLFLEESEQKDYVGLASFVALSYLLVPFQAYASIKGFLQKEEGPWFRTPKTGRITDVFTRGRFYRFISGILPGRAVPAPATLRSDDIWSNPYVALATANNHFNSFNIKPRRNKWLGKAVLSLLLAFTITIYAYTKGVPEILATAITNKVLYLQTDASGVLTGSHQLTEGSGGTCDIVQSAKHGKSITDYIIIKPDITNNNSPTFVANCPASASGTGWIFDTPFDSSNGLLDGDWIFDIYTSDNTTANYGFAAACVYRVAITANAVSSSTLFFQATGSTDVWINGALNSQIPATDPCGAGCTFTSSEKYLYVEYWIDSDNGANSAQATVAFGDENCGTTHPQITIESYTIPENAIVFALLTPFIPFLMKKWKKRKKFAL